MSSTSRNEERSTSSAYPKAGLILRTSSFKRSSPDKEVHDKTERYVTSETVIRRKSETGKSFLNDQSKVRNVQDVITRMKTEGNWYT